MKIAKVYNILLYIILISIIIVIALLIIKYTRNQINEKDLKLALNNIYNTQLRQENVTQEIEAEYKGNKIIGIIKIPKINIEYPILDSTSNETMKISVTKFWGKGVHSIGNLCISGHNNKDGTMFGKIKELELEDIIEMTNMKKVTKQYVIYAKYIIDSNNISIINTDEIGTREVTLITCTNGNKNRLIIKAREIK